jgi:7-cyano-7-deazaguanine synthase in queuosine biosynthesis
MNSWLGIEDDKTVLVMLSGGLDSAVAAEKILRETGARLVLAHVKGPHHWAVEHYNAAHKILTHLERINRGHLKFMQFENNWPINPSISFLYHFVASQIMRNESHNVDMWVHTAQYIENQHRDRRPYSRKIYEAGSWKDWRKTELPKPILYPFEGVDKNTIWNMASEFVKENSVSCCVLVNDEPCGECPKCLEIYDASR